MIPKRLLRLSMGLLAVAVLTSCDMGPPPEYDDPKEPPDLLDWLLSGMYAFTPYPTAEYEPPLDQGEVPPHERTKGS